MSITYWTVERFGVRDVSFVVDHYPARTVTQSFIDQCCTMVVFDILIANTDVRRRPDHWHDSFSSFCTRICEFLDM